MATAEGAHLQQALQRRLEQHQRVIRLRMGMTGSHLPGTFFPGLKRPENGMCCYTPMLPDLLLLSDSVLGLRVSGSRA